MAFRARPTSRSAHRLAEAPYAPGWLDRLINFIGRLPGPNTAWCLLLMLVQAAWVLAMLGGMGHGIPWERLFSVVITPGLLWTRFHLDSVAASSMDKFRPMLQVDDQEFERLRYELTTLSARTSNAWETSTLTGFLTTLGLPILLWLLQRGLERSGF